MAASFSAGALGAFLDETARRLQIPAAFCVGMEDHRVLFSWRGGVSPDALRKSAGAHFWVYSATKPVCAAAAMQMVEAGLLALDEPAAAYLPALADLTVLPGGAPARALTVRHLLTMQGGFDYTLRPPAVLRLLRETGGTASTRQIASAFAEAPLQFQPGTHFQYSLCLDVLGAVMEAAAGVTLGEWMQAHLFAPLAMEESGFSPRAPLAPQFRLTPEGRIVPAGEDCFCRLTPQYESGGGGLCMTLSDYCRFADAMACGGADGSGARILRSGSIDRMRKNRLGPRSLSDFRRRYTRPGYGYGLGVRVSLGGAEPRGVFGWDGAAGVHVLMDPDRRRSLVYFQHVLDLEILYDHVFDRLDRLFYQAFPAK